MSKNVGRIDAYLRISSGLLLISLAIMKKKGWLAALGSLKVAEGVTRYCPVLDLCHCTTLTDEEILEEVLGLSHSEFDDYCDCDYDDYDDYDCTCDDDCDANCQCDCHVELSDDELEDIEDYQEEGI
ncbi:MAG TPA: DUF2892 domain-containing protein [Firmicutes bacterium]|nr:DUF2892 domain-containing protein [Bacillota bacterium]